MSKTTSAVVQHELHACDAALARAFDFLGKRWNGLILGALSSGPLGFGELRRGVPGIGDSTLSDRLTELTAGGLVTREVAPGPPVSVTYALGPAGEALVPALQDLAAWADEHLTESSCAAARRKRTRE